MAAWTPRAIQRGLLDDYPLDEPAVAALGRLTTELENGRYAPPGEELGRTAAERMTDVSAVLAAVAAPLSGRTRWRARIWPASGLEALTGLGSVANTGLEWVGRRISVWVALVLGKLGIATGPGAPEDPSSGAGASSAPGASSASDSVGSWGRPGEGNGRDDDLGRPEAGDRESLNRS